MSFVVSTISHTKTVEPFNLINSNWIHVQRKSGKNEYICPAQIIDSIAEDPIVRVITSRPDFDSALLQFFIGLVTTAFMPENEEKWFDFLYDPPSVAKLDAKFQKIARAFDLTGDGPRFMQDSGFERVKKNRKQISFLLPEYPAENTIKENRDLFIKRTLNENLWMSHETAAIALLSLQLNAPSGGSGHRTSLRGSKALTTFALGKTLWETVWLNVLSRDDFYQNGKSQLKNLLVPEIFPWLGPTKTSENNNPTLPNDLNRLTVFWATPRRIYLNFETKTKPCMISGSISNGGCTNYFTKNYGVNYHGWIHPLSPYKENKTGELIPMRGQNSGGKYQHWIGFVLEDKRQKLQPAQTIQILKKRSSEIKEYYEDQEISYFWQPIVACGFDFDNMKALEWIESRLKGYFIDKNEILFYEKINSLIAVAENILFTTRQSIKRAMFGRPQTDGKKTKWFVSVDTKKSTLKSLIVQKFWNDTEDSFYLALEKTHQMLQTSDHSSWELIARCFVKSLRSEAINIFDHFTKIASFSSANPKTLAIARKEIFFFTHANSSKIVKLLNISKTKKITSKDNTFTILMNQLFV